ncbi:MAG: RNA polymerase sigma factor [Bacteroidota bacterium]|nr:RNA polymerase sigma factor [Bacteroidota bacterium]
MEDLSTVIQGCVANDPKQQRAFYEHYFGYCLKVVFRYVYRYETAVDIVNDGFVKVFRNFGKFVPADKENLQMVLMGWMRTIMIHAAIDQLRKNSFLPEIGSISEAAWEVEDKTGHADKNVLYKELILHIKKLSPAYRAVFNLYVIDGFSHQEIAEKLGISVGTSKSNLSKARVILQNILQQNEPGMKHAISQ